MEPSNDASKLFTNQSEGEVQKEESKQSPHLHEPLASVSYMDEFIQIGRSFYVDTSLSQVYQSVSQARDEYNDLCKDKKYSTEAVLPRSPDYIKVSSETDEQLSLTINKMNGFIDNFINAFNDRALLDLPYPPDKPPGNIIRNFFNIILPKIIDYCKKPNNDSANEIKSSFNQIYYWIDVIKKDADRMSIPFNLSSDYIRNTLNELFGVTEGSEAIESMEKEPSLWFNWMARSGEATLIVDDATKDVWAACKTGEKIKVQSEYGLPPPGYRGIIYHSCGCGMPLERNVGYKLQGVSGKSYVVDSIVLHLIASHRNKFNQQEIDLINDLPDRAIDCNEAELKTKLRHSYII
jgi:hypothetical protein